MEAKQPIGASYEWTMLTLLQEGRNGLTEPYLMSLRFHSAVRTASGGDSDQRYGFLSNKGTQTVNANLFHVSERTFRIFPGEVIEDTVRKNF